MNVKCAFWVDLKERMKQTVTRCTVWLEFMVVAYLKGVRCTLKISLKCQHTHTHTQITASKCGIQIFSFECSRIAITPANIST